MKWFAGTSGCLVLGLMIGCGGSADVAADHEEPSATAEALTAVSHSGRAWVVGADVLGIGTTLSDTGPLPSAGGNASASLLSAHVLGLIDAELLQSVTSGQGNYTFSAASVANVGLTVAGIGITADILQSSALVVCGDKGPTGCGQSDLARLTINGQTIAVTGAPNQTINLLVGKIVINEQSSTLTGSTETFRVSALHVAVPGIADVTISSAVAGITCTSEPPPCNESDTVLGHGFITSTPSGAHGTFALNAWLQGGVPTGTVLYNDDGSLEHVQSVDITNYIVTGPKSRRLQGHATVTNKAGVYTYTIDVTDYGNPAIKDDFAISVSDGYSATGTASPGDLQILHSCQ